MRNLHHFLIGLSFALAACGGNDASNGPKGAAASNAIQRAGNSVSSPPENAVQASLPANNALGETSAAEESDENLRPVSRATGFRIYPDTLVCLRQHISPAWRERFRVPGAGRYLGPVQGEFLRAMERAGQPVNLNGSSRVLEDHSESNPSSRPRYAAVCRVDGRNIRVTMRVDGRGKRDGYRLTWAVRQGTRVLRGGVERASVRDYPLRMRLSDMNPHSEALIEETPIIARAIKSYLRAESVRLTRLSGAEIRRRLVGHRIRPDRNVRQSFIGFTEDFRPDGTWASNRTERGVVLDLSGRWRIVGDRICVTMAQEPTSCRDVRTDSVGRIAMLGRGGSRDILIMSVSPIR